MQSNRDHQYHRRTQQSPQLFPERMSMGSQFKQVSPIQPTGWEAQDINHQNQNNGNPLLNENHYQFMDIDSPNTLIKEFYKNPQSLLKDVDEFYLDDNDSENQSLSHNFASQGNVLNEEKKYKNEIRNNDGNIEYAKYDLTSKNITTSKKITGNEKTKQLASGRESQSPIQSQTSRAETVKWAFSNKDSQETQKKVSVMNRQSAQALVTRSLKSHDSKKSEVQQTVSSQNPGSIKGKVLDFGTINAELESGILYKNTNLKKNLHQENYQDNGSYLKNEDEMVSFLEDVDDLLMNQIQNKKNQLSLSKEQFQFKGLKQQREILSEVLSSLIDNTMDCPLCNCQRIFDNSLQCSKIEDVKTPLQVIKENLERKYLTSREYYNVKIINDVIYNENTHIVSVFKDYLIFDDVSEFLKRFYSKLESIQRLPKMFEFYEKFSKVFPNYVILPENKYMFKNIERKQRLYDDKQRIILEQQEKEQKGNGLGSSAEKGKSKHRDRFSGQQNSSCISQLSNNKMFDTKFIDSVNNIEPSGFIDSVCSSRINNSQFQDHIQNSSILIQQHLQENLENAKKHRQNKKGIKDLNLDELISKFIAKDSESNIQQSTILPLTEQPKNVTKQTNSKKNVYDYQAKPIIKDKSKQSDTSGRPTSSKSRQENKRLSSGASNQKQQVPIHKQDEVKNILKSIPQQSIEGRNDGQMINYNIYNNFIQSINNKEPTIEQTNSDNGYKFYIHFNNFPENLQQNTNCFNPMMGSEDGNQLKSNENQMNQGGLQRNQSKPNLHPKSGDKQDKLITPSKVGNPIKEVVTPQSSNAQQEKKTQLLQRNKKNFTKGNENKPEYFTSGHQDDLKKESTQNRSNNSVQRLDTNSSPLNINKQKQINTGVYPTGLNTLGTSLAGITSRDQSKDKQQQNRIINPKQQISNNGNIMIQNSNQMFKKDFQTVTNTNLKKDKSQKLFHQQDQEYNQLSSQNRQAHSTNIRSVEKLKQIEEEIEKDYSKYVNEYGLTKTAFAKAVNSLREKQQSQIQQQPQQTTRVGRQSSNEKIKKSNTASISALRSGSTSQSRVQSNSRQQQQKITLSNQETINDLYMNTNTLRQDQQKPIRSVRAKTHLSSQNSSNCFQKSQKFSPDKNYLISNQTSQGNFIAFNQSTTPIQSSNLQTNNYITLKAQPSKSSKGIKIKFPINKPQNTSNNQTPKRIKLQKTKSTSNIPISFRPSSQQMTTLATSRGRATEMIIQDEMTSNHNGTSFLPSNQITRSTINQQYLGSQVLNDLITPDHQISQGLLPQQTFASNSCGGTYVTTSILNSPLSFKNQPVIQRNNSKNKNSSRNGNNSQHQSQKSINGHQRTASTANNVLQGSNSKKKLQDSKRMSAGSNLSKKPQQPSIHHHQPSQSNVQQQLIQLLMSYQNQQEGDQSIPLTQTVKNFQMQGMNSVSMKDLKSMKQSTTGNILRDVQMIKPKNIKSSNQGALIQQNQVLQSSRQLGNLQPNAILMSQNVKKSSKSGKNTARGDSKKKSHNLLQYQMVDAPSNLNHYQNYNTLNNQELSSRLGINNGDSAYMSQDHNKILSYSKSQENIELMKMAAQKAAQDQQYQQQLQSQQNVLLQSQSTKFLQNLKQQDNQQVMQKIRITPSTSQSQTQQLAPSQSARNINFESGNAQYPFQFRGGDYDHLIQSTKAPSTIILSQQNIQKAQSRRSSDKFQPQSGKNY